MRVFMASSWRWSCPASARLSSIGPAPAGDAGTTEKAMALAIAADNTMRQPGGSARARRSIAGTLMIRTPTKQRPPPGHHAGRDCGMIAVSPRCARRDRSGMAIVVLSMVVLAAILAVRHQQNRPDLRGMTEHDRVMDALHKLGGET